MTITTTLSGAHAALKDCWRRKTHTARTTVIRDDSDAVATCEEGYRVSDKLEWHGTGRRAVSMSSYRITNL